MLHAFFERKSLFFWIQTSKHYQNIKFLRGFRERKDFIKIGRRGINRRERGGRGGELAKELRLLRLSKYYLLKRHLNFVRTEVGVLIVVRLVE